MSGRESLEHTKLRQIKHKKEKIIKTDENGKWHHYFLLILACKKKEPSSLRTVVQHQNAQSIDSASTGSGQAVAGD